MPAYDDYDSPSPRMQPATKLMLALFGFCALVAVIGVIAAVAHRPGSEPEEAAANTPRSPSPSRPSPSPPSPTRSTAPDAPLDPVAGVVGVAGGTILGLSVLSFVLLIVALPLLFVATEVLLLAWVVKDARARGSDGAVWLIVILMSWLLGFLVYLASRPPGTLSPCEFCGNRRLDYLKRCPHCLRDA